MTTEEKARAYDESLKKARDYYDKCYMMINTALENIFPELKESDDERIRKDIIEHLKQDIELECTLSKEKGDKWIAWLEKQGEKKPLPPSSTR